MSQEVVLLWIEKLDSREYVVAGPLTLSLDQIHQLIQVEIPAYNRRIHDLYSGECPVGDYKSVAERNYFRSNWIFPKPFFHLEPSDSPWCKKLIKDNYQYLPEIQLVNLFQGSMSEDLPGLKQKPLPVTRKILQLEPERRAKDSDRFRQKALSISLMLNDLSEPPNDPIQSSTKIEGFFLFSADTWWEPIEKLKQSRQRFLDAMSLGEMNDYLIDIDID